MGPMGRRNPSPRAARSNSSEVSIATQAPASCLRAGCPSGSPSRRLWRPGHEETQMVSAVNQLELSRLFAVQRPEEGRGVNWPRVRLEPRHRLSKPLDGLGLITAGGRDG